MWLQKGKLNRNWHKLREWIFSGNAWYDAYGTNYSPPIRCSTWIFAILTKTIHRYSCPICPSFVCEQHYLVPPCTSIRFIDEETSSEPDRHPGGQRVCNYELFTWRRWNSVYVGLRTPALRHLPCRWGALYRVREKRRAAALNLTLYLCVMLVVPVKLVPGVSAHLDVIPSSWMSWCHAVAVVPRCKRGSTHFRKTLSPSEMPPAFQLVSEDMGALMSTLRNSEHWPHDTAERLHIILFEFRWRTGLSINDRPEVGDTGNIVGINSKGLVRSVIAGDTGRSNPLPDYALFGGDGERSSWRGRNSAALFIVTAVGTWTTKPGQAAHAAISLQMWQASAKKRLFTAEVGSRKISYLIRSSSCNRWKKRKYVLHRFHLNANGLYWERTALKMVYKTWMWTLLFARRNQNDIQSIEADWAGFLPYWSHQPTDQRSSPHPLEIYTGNFSLASQFLNHYREISVLITPANIMSLLRKIRFYIAQRRYSFFYSDLSPTPVRHWKPLVLNMFASSSIMW